MINIYYLFINALNGNGYNSIAQIKYVNIIKYYYYDGIFKIIITIL